MEGYSTKRRVVSKNTISMERFYLYEAPDSSTPNDMNRLVDVLEQAICIAFSDYSGHYATDNSIMGKNKRKLLKQVALFESELKNRHYTTSDLIVMRLETIHTLIYDLFILLGAYKRYSAHQNSAAEERQLLKDSKTFYQNMSSSFSKLNRYEQLDLAHIARQKDAALLTKNAAIFINKDHINPSFHEAFKPSFQYQRRVSGSANGQGLMPNYEIEQALRRFPSNLEAAYTETEAVRTEVAGIANISPEDEYFVEQISESYYPAILTALQTIPVRSAAQEDTLITEIVKQFESIQLGLHRITDKAVEQRITQVRLQTEFLQNKVLGTHTLSLSKDTLTKTVEEHLVEAKTNRVVREEAAIMEQVAFIANHTPSKASSVGQASSRRNMENDCSLCSGDVQSVKQREQEWKQEREQERKQEMARELISKLFSADSYYSEEEPASNRESAQIRDNLTKIQLRKN